MDEEDMARGEETPEEGEIHGDAGGSNADVEMLPADDASTALREMKRRLKELEDESAAFREMHARREKEMELVQDADGEAATQASKEEVDSRSIYVGNVNYSCTPEEVHQHFNSCGTVNRVTILTDQFGHPKGYAYVEFLEHEAVQNALHLNESELHGRQLKVSAKRTNIPGMKPYRPGHYTSYMGDVYMNPQRLPYYHSPYGYGKYPQFRGPNRYMPYY